VSGLDTIAKEFVVESNENLDQLEIDLMALEGNPSSRETLASIFRTVHTIKGAAGFMRLPKLEALAHSGESLLSRLRDGVLVINPVITSALLALADCIRQMLTHIEQAGTEGDTDGTAIVERLARVGEGAGQTRPQQHDGDLPTQTAAGMRPDPSEGNRAVLTNVNVRVSVEHLDKLMNLVGELVLARNEIVQLSAVQESSVLLNTSQRLNSITTLLREGIMKTRMQPIDKVWNKLPRVVRDASQYCGKRVRLEMEGKDTELDRTLIEAIQDPLTHVIRNSIDHGLEAPEKRIAAGKSAEGRICLRAFHEGGQVTIEVSDDGAGIDVAAIRRKALERGLITPEQSRGMSEQEAMSMVFLPGLSTAEKVTSMSGRGVGMDVVKTNIEQIGGKVSIHSEAGVGTTLRMRIPLTLAIMTALVVTSGNDCYAIPQVNVLELVRLEAKDARSRIEMMCDAAVYRLRGELLPLVWLDGELTSGGSEKTRSASIGRLTECDAINIVVLHADHLKFGLIVDDVNDTQEIVVKPLGRHVRGIPIFAGATVMGNGRVALILDIPGLAVKSGVLSDARDKSAVRSDVSLEAEPEPKEALLLFSGPDDTRMAIPLSKITRLEEFSRSAIERVGNRDVVQYVGDILSLTDIASLLPNPRAHNRASLTTTAESLQVLVYSKDGRQMGVVVDRIIDTVEARLVNLRPTTRPGVTGSVVIDGRVTEIIDLDTLCADVLAASGPARTLAGAVV
jgi:two-component system chemotaxis sensor kinase CheA